MRPIHRQVCSALAVLAWMAAPAAAQTPQRPRDLGRDIEAQIEQQFELLGRQIERFIDHDLADLVDDIADDVERAVEKHGSKIQYKVQQKVQVLAQRAAGEAARRAAQASREAERRRRQEARRGPEFTEPISRTLRLGRNGTFDLRNVSGDIVVTGGSGSDVRIDAIKRVRHQNESEARALLRAIDVRIDERNGNVEVRTDYPRRNWSGGVDFTVSLPRDANVVLNSISGDIRVTSLNGELRAETVSGNLRATSVRRVRHAKTVSGDLEIGDSDGDELAGQSVSGTVTVRGVKARTVDLQTVSGDLRLTDVESDRAFGKSVSGNVEFSGRLARNGRYEFQSHSGDVRVSPLASSGFSIEASTFSGNLRSDYPLTLNGGSAVRRYGRGLRGSFGEGGAVLSLQSFSGNVTIVKR